MLCLWFWDQLIPEEKHKNNILLTVQVVLGVPLAYWSKWFLCEYVLCFYIHTKEVCSERNREICTKILVIWNVIIYNFYSIMRCQSDHDISVQGMWKHLYKYVSIRINLRYWDPGWPAIRLLTNHLHDILGASIAPTKPWLDETGRGEQ